MRGGKQRCKDTAYPEPGNTSQRSQWPHLPLLTDDVSLHDSTIATSGPWVLVDTKDLWSAHCPQLLRERSGKTGRTMVSRGQASAILQKVEEASNRGGSPLGKQEPQWAEAEAEPPFLAIVMTLWPPWVRTWPHVPSDVIYTGCTE